MQKVRGGNRKTRRPFPPPKRNGKGEPQIAIKVINHYADEVMKVYRI